MQTEAPPQSTGLETLGVEPSNVLTSLPGVIRMLTGLENHL